MFLERSRGVRASVCVCVCTVVGVAAARFLGRAPWDRKPQKGGVTRSFCRAWPVWHARLSFYFSIRSSDVV